MGHPPDVLVLADAPDKPVPSAASHPPPPASRLLRRSRRAGPAQWPSRAANPAREPARRRTTALAFCPVARSPHHLLGVIRLRFPALPAHPVMQFACRVCDVDVALLHVKGAADQRRAERRTRHLARPRGRGRNLAFGLSAAGNHRGCRAARGVRRAPPCRRAIWGCAGHGRGRRSPQRPGTQLNVIVLDTSAAVGALIG